nr:B8L protein - variola virus (strain India-1967) [Variola virus]
MHQQIITNTSSDRAIVVRDAYPYNLSIIVLRMYIPLSLNALLYLSLARIMDTLLIMSYIS